MTTTIDRDEPVTVKPGRAAKADRKGPRRRISARTVINTITILVLLYLVLGPLIMLVVSAFEDTSGGVVITPPFPWTGANFDTVFTSSETYSVLWTTVLFSGGALIFAFAVSLTFAWLVERTDMPARNTIFVLVVAPQGMPALISAIAWSLLLNPTNGFLNEVLRSV
ncbi:MAG: iron(III) transport system permease protein, partial [Pseudonocardiales bacterium]|nr:iron(III) transport system permease protein [Pseudonocardiales bacterium]